MIQAPAIISTLLRPLLFVLLLLYLPLKTGFLSNIFIKPPNAKEIRSSREILIPCRAIRR